MTVISKWEVQYKSALEKLMKDKKKEEKSKVSKIF
jgi:hypothetical protein